MRTVRRRSPWSQLLTVLVLLVAGPYVGLQLGVRLTPGSDVAQVVSPLAFALILVGGLVVWFGFAVVAVVVAFFWKLLRGRNPWDGRPRPSEVEVPPGSRVFIILGVVLGGAAGCVAGLLGELDLMTAVAVWTGAGTAYGAALWAAAFHGYLPFPEPE